ncbi:MAG: aminotransferase class I/II-fold pyridoxal phosphate-dependent enzyme [Caldisericia bacterium]|nr:aminotransferase class I/II-fold pyridoxal phosphate-dependent enzyme [Caldisericia bacterium]
MNYPLRKRIEKFQERFDDLKKRDLYFYQAEIEEINGAHAIVEGKDMIIFASYSYLGLINHPKINEAAKKAIDELSTGTHGVRLLAGTTRLHNELERKIAEFKGREAAAVFSSGYVTNLTTISTLLGKDDYIFCDKYDHASIVDGAIQSRANFIRFDHNDMEHLEDLLKEVPDDKVKLIVVDAVYSMDGDMTPLPDLIELKEKYNAILMVDEAHSLGVLGEHGRGIEEHFHVEGKVDIDMGTLSKTIPSVGGYIAGDKDLIDYVKHNSRAYIFSAALPPPAVAAAKASFDVIEEEPWRREKLWENIEHFVSGLKKLGYDTMNTQSAVVPVLLGEDELALKLTRKLWDEGILIFPILTPAIPPKTARLRCCVMASHSHEDIEKTLKAFEKAGKELGII